MAGHVLFDLAPHAFLRIRKCIGQGVNQRFAFPDLLHGKCIPEFSLPLFQKPQGEDETEEFIKHEPPPGLLIILHRLRKMNPEDGFLFARQPGRVSHRSRQILITVREACVKCFLNGFCDLLPGKPLCQAVNRD